MRTMAPYWDSAMRGMTSHVLRFSFPVFRCLTEEFSDRINRIHKIGQLKVDLDKINLPEIKTCVVSKREISEIPAKA